MNYIVRSQVRPEESSLLAGAEDGEFADDESPELCGEIHSSWVARSVDIIMKAATENLSYLVKQYLKLEAGEQDEMKSLESHGCGSWRTSDSIYARGLTLITR